MGRLDPERIDTLLDGVAAADDRATTAWPGPGSARQPIHVLYVPADTVTATTTADAGARAADLMARHAPNGPRLADATEIPIEVADDVHARVAAKLHTEPVEDLRIDFEDGYGQRPDDVEDADTVTAATHLATMLDGPAAPSFCGLRVKSFTDGLARRSVATLDLFLATLLDLHGSLPDGFAVTFPKIMATDHVAAFVDVLAALEQVHGLPTGSLGFEAQVETPASILAADGRVTLRGIQAAGDGRLRSVHFGVFDYTAALGLPAESQRLDHPACDLARHLIQVTFADTEVTLSDGSSNIRPADDGAESVRAVWRHHAGLVRHSLAHGFMQGWDMDPSHLVSRHATVFAHLIDGIDDVVARLAAWHSGTSVGATMDEPATIAVLTRHVQRALACGAVTDDRVAAAHA